MNGKTYNASTTASISSNGSLTNGGTTSGDGKYLTNDVVSIASGGSAGFGLANAGLQTATGSLTLQGTDAADYTLTAPTASATIAQEAITITAANQNQTYGSVSLGTSAFTVTSGAVQSGDSISSVTLSPVDINSLGTSGSGNLNVGTYEILGSGASGTGGFNTSNYTISYAPTGRLTVSQLGLTVSGISGTGQTYNASTVDALSTGSAALSGKVSGDVVTLGGSAVGTLASANAGTEAVTVSGYNVSGADAANYSFSQPSVASVTISPLYVVLAGTRIYDNTTAAPASALTINNNLDGSNLTLSGTGTLSSVNVGSEPFANTGSLALGGSAAGNYSLAGVTSNASAMQITAQAVAVTLVRQQGL